MQTHFFPCPLKIQNSHKFIKLVEIFKDKKNRNNGEAEIYGAIARLYEWLHVSGNKGKLDQFSLAHIHELFYYQGSKSKQFFEALKASGYLEVYPNEKEIYFPCPVNICDDYKFLIFLEKFKNVKKMEAYGAIVLFYNFMFQYFPEGDLRNVPLDQIKNYLHYKETKTIHFLDCLEKAGYTEETPYLRVANWWSIAHSFLSKYHYRFHPQKCEKIKKQYEESTPHILKELNIKTV